MVYTVSHKEKIETQGFLHKTQIDCLSPETGISDILCPFTDKLSLQAFCSLYIEIGPGALKLFLKCTHHELFHVTLGQFVLFSPEQWENRYLYGH